MKEKADSVFYPSSEIVLMEESDAYRHTFKNLLEALEIFFADKPNGLKAFYLKTANGMKVK